MTYKYQMEPEPAINHLKLVHNTGKAYAKLDGLIRHEMFDNLSKHNPYWDSEHEIESDKLHDIRMRLQTIQETISDVMVLIDPQP